MTAERNYSIDILRILACISVVMVHTVGVPTMKGVLAEGSLDYYLCLFWQGCIRWGVPVFLMITGYYMLDPLKNNTPHNVLTKRFPRIFCALVFWSAVYALVLHTPFYPFGSYQCNHLWYLGVLIGIYVALPVLRLIASNVKMLEYFVLAWFAFMVYENVGAFVPLPFDPQSTVFAGYAGYCLLGYYLRWFSSQTDRLHVNIRKAIYIIGIIGMVITMLGGILTNNDDSVWFGYLSPNVILSSAALLLYFSLHPIKLSGKTREFVLNLSGCTFGIYLVHLLLLIESYNRIQRFIPYTIPHLLVTVAFAFVMGYAVTFVLKKIPVVNKYIV